MLLSKCPKNMSISVNGQSQVPPGFRFHPTEEELLHYYLKKKVGYEKIDLDVILDVDLNKVEPWDIQEKCKIGSSPQNDWYFFSHKDKKYPTGSRTNRATAAGFWKATGRDKVIYSNGTVRIGMRKTLVFYQGRAPHGLKSDWIMHEYRLDDNTTDNKEEGWVVCRIFMKKIVNKIIPSSTMQNSGSEGSFEQIFEYMGRSCSEEKEVTRFLLPINTNINYDRFKKLPSLESPNSTSSQNYFQHIDAEMMNNQVSGDPNSVNYEMDTSLSNWVALDRLVASQLNWQTETSSQLACDHVFQLPQIRHNGTYRATSQDYNTEMELWNFTRSSSLSSLFSSSDPLCHVSSTTI